MKSETSSQPEHSETGAAQAPSDTILRHDRLTPKAVGITFLLCALWGGGAPAIKISLAEFPPFALAFWRFLIALTVILIWCKVRRIEWRVPRRFHKKLFGFSLLFVLQILFLNAGLFFTSSNHGVVFLNANPLFVAAMAHLFIPQDRLSLQKSSGLVLAFTGICLIFFDIPNLRQPDPLLGDILVLVSAILLAAIQICLKFLVHEITPFQIVVWQMLYGVPLFFCMSLLFEDNLGYGLTSSVGAALLYQSIVAGAICFVGWNHLLKRFSASKVTSFRFSIPVFGVFFGWLLLNESISRSFAAGVGLVAFGIFLVSRAPQSGPSAAGDCSSSSQW